MDIDYSVRTVFEFAHSWIFQYKKGLFWKGFHIHNKVLYLDITILSAVDKIFISLRIVREWNSILMPGNKKKNSKLSLCSTMLRLAQSIHLWFLAVMNRVKHRDVSRSFLKVFVHYFKDNFLIKFYRKTDFILRSLFRKSSP